MWLAKKIKAYLKHVIMIEAPCTFLPEHLKMETFLLGAMLL